MKKLVEIGVVFKKKLCFVAGVQTDEKVLNSIF